MAVIFIPSERKLRLMYSQGVDEEGKPQTRSRTLSKVKMDATAADLYDAAHALGDLSEDHLSSVRTYEIDDLLNDA